MLLSVYQLFGDTHCNHLWVAVILELQVIYWGHFIFPELNITWICETKATQLFLILCVCVSTHVILSEADLSGGSRGPPASYTESHSNSEGWSGCNGPARAQPAGSSPACPYHCSQRTTGRDTKVRWGEMSQTWWMALQTQFKVTSPSQRIHHGWWSTLCCRCWRPGSRTSHSRSWKETIHGQHMESENTVHPSVSGVLLVQGVPSLCYDRRELCVAASVQLKPVDCVLRVGTPCSASHVIFIIRALQTTDATTHNYWVACVNIECAVWRL